MNSKRAKELFLYDKSTGEIFWKITKGARAPANSIAGGISCGYRVVHADGVKLYGHRIAWMLEIGDIPPKMNIDHINGNGLDNRISNLRLCNQSQNSANAKMKKNNSSGYKGVYFCKSSKKWAAEITQNGRKSFLGYFPSPEMAHEEYMRAARIKFGSFARAA